MLPNLTFRYGSWCVLLTIKYNVDERRKIHHFRLLVKKARQAFRGTLKVAFLTYAAWSSWSQEEEKKSLKGVSKAEHSFVYKKLLGAWNPAKYRIYKEAKSGERLDGWEAFCFVSGIKQHRS